MDTEPTANPVTAAPETLQNAVVDVTRLIYMLYQDVEQQISRADFKAQITLSTSAILAAVMSNLGLGVTKWRLAEMDGRELAALVIWILSAACLCSAIGYALSATFPRSAGQSSVTPATPNLYFSGHLIHLPPEEYAQRFCAQTNHEVKIRTLQQIQVKSTVLEAKLRCVRRGLMMLVAALACWATARLLLLASTGALDMPKQMLSGH
jgi:hypothetical protein